MKNQPAIQLDAWEAAKQADLGIQQTHDTANKKDPAWTEKAYSFLIQWLFKQHFGHQFFVEDIREAAHRGGVPLPPSNRAWGGLILRAKKDKLVEFAGHGNTRNVKAHRTPASIWKKI